MGSRSLIYSTGAGFSTWSYGRPYRNSNAALNKPTIASSTRFEGHNYLTAVHVRIICFAIVIRMGMINAHNHSNACVVIFEESYGTLHYATWVLRVLCSTRRGSHRRRLRSLWLREAAQGRHGRPRLAWLGAWPCSHRPTPCPPLAPLLAVCSTGG
jgi:hypothetical protein